MKLQLSPCNVDELIRRAKLANILTDDYAISAEKTEDFPSAAEAICSDLRLPEDQLFALLGMEYSIPSMPLDLLANMQVLEDFRQEEMLTIFRREGFVPVERARNGVILVVLGYPYNDNSFMAIESCVGIDVEFVLGSDRTLAGIFSNSVLDDTTEFEVGEVDDGFYLGAEDEETMFPGLYGGGASELLYEDTTNDSAESSAQQGHKTQGHVEDLGYLDMLQMMAQSQKTGSLFVKSPNFGEVYIFFDKGQVVHCITEFENGEEGFYRVIGLTEGEFEIVMGPVNVEQTITTTTNGLIMEGLRRLDEASADNSTTANQVF